MVLLFLKYIYDSSRRKSYSKTNNFSKSSLIGIGFELIIKTIEYIFKKRKDGQNIESIEKYHYQRKDYFMTRAEHECFNYLQSLVGEQYYIFPQVHLSTILDEKIVGQNWRGALAHIEKKSVDYVICDKAYIKPIMALELDDLSHEREDRVERDGIVENIFKEAKLPLLRFENQGQLNKDEITNKVLEVLRMSAVPAAV